jgi:hypothetical protein
VRNVTLVVVDAGGELRGQLPSFTVPTPWWQDLEPLVLAHPELVILRLLHAEPAPCQVMGGDVVYLAQADPRPAGLVPFTGAADWLAAHPLRMPWARRLLRPVAVARAAVVFQRFLENIEPSERIYHYLDVDPYLAAADELLLAGRVA